MREGDREAVAAGRLNESSSSTGGESTSAAPLAVRAEHLSKRYSLGSRVPGLGRYRPQPSDAGALSPDVLDDVEDDVDELIPEEPDESRAVSREVWALRDVSIAIPAGTITGTVGPNGAGKTTLLRILSRVTLPTSGRVVVRGRVAPLAGFVARFLEPDLTARQNILLLADLLDLPREIAFRQLDTILEFAGLTGYGDTELKRYASGFIQRLAFSTVLNLEPDILLADGMPSFGDAEFRKRSLERLLEANEDGQTLLIATHDMKLVRRMCHYALILDSGQVVDEGEAAEIAARHDPEGSASPRRARRASHAVGDPESDDLERDGTRASRLAERSASKEQPKLSTEANEPPARGSSEPDIEIERAGVCLPDGAPLETLRPDQEATIEIILAVGSAGARVRCGLALVEPSRGRRRNLRISQKHFVRLAPAERYRVSVRLPPGTLPQGEYVGHVRVQLVKQAGRELVELRRAFRLTNQSDSSKNVGTSASSDLPRRRARGLEWQVDLVPSEAEASA